MAASIRFFPLSCIVSRSTWRKIKASKDAAPSCGGNANIKIQRDRKSLGSGVDFSRKPKGA